MEHKIQEAGAIENRSFRKDFIDSIREEHFHKFELSLHKSISGPRWLADRSVAEVVAEAIHYRDGTQYDLYAFTIMPNHVHMICKPIIPPDSSGCELTDILENLKWYTALHSNAILCRTGAFWQHESYDHVIRDSSELHRTIWYVLNNPVAAGLATTWQSWPWSYAKAGLL